MRVVVATDAIAGLPPDASAELIAHAFADLGATVAVVPLAGTGPALHAAIASCAPGFEIVAPATSAELGEALRGSADRLLLDLTATRVDDLGRAALGEAPREELSRLRDAWQGRELVALVPEEQLGRDLTGLSGFASTELRAEGHDLKAVLVAEGLAERWAAELGLTPGRGSGAARGLGLLLQGLGVSVTDPLTFLTGRFGLETTIAEADLVVTGAEELDFHALGGPVVKKVVAMAGEALRPAIAIVGRNFVSSRELRLGGFESAHPLLTGAGDDVATPERLSEVAGKVARTWLW